jgi:hypothetical protein
VEPKILQLGKEFHRRVQSDWKRTAEGEIHCEHVIAFGIDKKHVAHFRRGRLDIFVDKVSDFVAVIEIKSTDWEKVKPKNFQKLLSAHSTQVWKYVGKYLDADGTSVCPGIIYPKAPRSAGLKVQVERHFSDSCIQIVWYDEP